MNRNQNETNAERELRLIASKRSADTLRENARQRAEAEARKLLIQSRNVANYTDATGVSPSFRAQVQAKMRAAGIGAPRSVQQQAAAVDVANTIQTLRAINGIETPSSDAVGYVPTIEETLNGVDLEAEALQGDELPGEPKQPSFTALDLAKVVHAEPPPSRQAAPRTRRT